MLQSFFFPIETVNALFYMYYTVNFKNIAFILRSPIKRSYYGKYYRNTLDCFSFSTDDNGILCRNIKVLVNRSNHLFMRLFYDLITYDQHTLLHHQPHMNVNSSLTSEALMQIVIY